MVECANKHQITISSEDALTLEGQMKIVNWLYNQLLSIANDLRSDFIKNQSTESARTLYSKRGLRDLVPAIKKKCPFLRTVHSFSLKNGALRLCSVIGEHQNITPRKAAG